MAMGAGPGATEYPQEAIERFISHINKTETCWLWTSAINVWGYGQFGIRHFRGRIQCTIIAHRMSYELHKGKIPKGMFVCHTCDVPACVNPQHLFLGTPKDNVDDMIRKGRKKILVGEEACNVKLTNQQVLEIRKLYKKGVPGFGQLALAKRFGIGRTAIENIVKGKTWTHL